MKIRNISLRVVSLLVLTFVFVVATAVFTVFDIRTQTENMETSLAEEARTFAREMDAVWEFMDTRIIESERPRSSLGSRVSVPITSTLFT